MSIRTTKMVTSDQYNISPACKVWFPCNEGSGDTITDLISGIVIPDSASAEHDAPHAVTIISTEASSSPIISIPAGKQIVVLYGSQTVASGTLNKFTLGDISGTRIACTGSVGSSTVQFEDDDNVEVKDDAGLLTQVATQNCFIAGHLNGVTGDLTSIDSVNNSAMAANTPITGSCDGSFTIDPTESGDAAISVATPQHIYGYAIWAFDTVPSDLVAGLEWMRAAWTAGRKEHYPGWAALT